MIPFLQETHWEKTLDLTLVPWTLIGTIIFIMRVGVIRVITISEKEELERHGKLIERLFPGIETVSACIQDQPRGVYDRETERLAAEKVVRLASEMEGNVDAIFISCAADPGVEELKGKLSVPVVGAGECLASLARALGQKVGVLTIAEGVPEPIRRDLRGFLWEKVEGAESTLDLRSRLDSVLQAAKALLRKGCDVIALACTGFSTIGAAPLIRRETGVPALDPVVAAGSVLYNLLCGERGW